MRRCECGSDSFPLHHCRLICQACRNGACSQGTIEGRASADARPSCEAMPPATIHPTYTAELTPLGWLAIVGLALLPLALIPIAAEFDRQRTEEQERRFFRLCKFVDEFESRRRIDEDRKLDRALQLLSNSLQAGRRI